MSETTVSTVSRDMCDTVTNRDIFTKGAPPDVKSIAMMLGGAGVGPITELSLCTVGATQSRLSREFCH
jgi:hypothetical protein